MKRLQPIALLGAVCTAVFGSGVQAQHRVLSWQQSPIIFLPSEAAPGQRTVEEGEVIVTLPLHWAFSTRLSRDVVLQHGDESVVLASGSLLPKVQVRIPDGSRRAGFCTRSRVAEHRECVGFMGLMFGNALNGLQDQQTCLEDTDKDMQFDRAFVLGDGDAVVELGAIEPLVFTELIAEPMGTDDDYAKITLAGVGRREIQLGFDIVQRGHARNFTTMRSGRFSAGRFSSYDYASDGATSFSLMGVQFEMDAYDRAANTAHLRWAPKVEPHEFVGVPDNVVTTFTW